MERGTGEKERVRQADIEAQRAQKGRGPAKRGTTATCAHEEMAHRRNQRCKAEIEARGVVTATQPERHRAIARLCGEEAAEVMKLKPQRLPGLVLESPHEAAPAFH